MVSRPRWTFLEDREVTLGLKANSLASQIDLAFLHYTPFTSHNDMMRHFFILKERTGVK